LDNSMSWVVTLDESNMNQNYGTGYIPTMYIVNQTGYVIYREIGFNYQGVVDALNELITATEENATPIFNDYIIWLGLFSLFLLRKIRRSS
ncbi:MAG: TlpA family protein disulfide reductase, partial [Candidatus Kariarchaeaceae archaeon]